MDTLYFQKKANHSGEITIIMVMHCPETIDYGNVRGCLHNDGLSEKVAHEQVLIF